MKTRITFWLIIGIALVLALGVAFNLIATGTAFGVAAGAILWLITKEIIPAQNKIKWKDL